ncbi:MAG: sigma-70 family RNA polymerase sigma factor [Phycisphaera sp.]|nr:sigma-70 family RNA polymerase sigma factor [Phycisphaera sp.]
MDTNERIHDFDDFALDMVNIKATQLVGKAGFTLDDIDDIKQEMILDLLERLTKYDSSKSNFKLFVTCVIDRKGRNLIRHRQMEMRDHRREVCSLNDEINVGINSDPVPRYSLMDQDDSDIRSGKYRRPAEERNHLRIDMVAVLDELPPELRRAVELLQSMSVTQTAREMGIPRRTFREKHLAQLRELFKAKGLDQYLS